MKRIVSLLIVMVLLLGCVGLIACGTKNSGTTQNPTGGSKTSNLTSSTTAGKSISASGLNWSDVPIYSGAGKIDTYQWAGSIPGAQGDFSKFEYRYYETSDSLDKVGAFYKSQMPANGWTETGWMDTSQLKYGMYTKNSENDEAFVELMSDTSNKGKTIMILWRGTK